jgi:hypothetical protein
MVTLGTLQSFTVMVDTAVFLQPLASVPVTVHVLTPITDVLGLMDAVVDPLQDHV